MSSRTSPPLKPLSPTSRPLEHRRDGVPASLTLPFLANTSTSVASSTAEGRPIPVDDSTAEHRTWALREINSHYPSRHRYAKSTGAQNSTYSEPVIVRSYYSPGPGRRDGLSRRRIGGRSKVPSHTTGSARGAGRGLLLRDRVSSASNGVLNSVAGIYGKKSAPAPPQDAKLPPIEAFSFKSFMAGMDAQTGGMADINADLDRIAEICARSRYSLSNQYEVHHAPHGSGSWFLASAQNPDTAHGPTLQVVSSDDERDLMGDGTSAKRRRHAARRNSRAMGTLETIMSSSRSSEEDKATKKSAAELADKVRGRTSRKGSGKSEGSTEGSMKSAHAASSQEDGETQKPRPRRHSTSLALIEASTDPAGGGGTNAGGLVGEPAEPQASSSQLETRTAPEPEAEGGRDHARGAISSEQDAAAGTTATWTGWWLLPWRTGSKPGRAEGSLRELLKGRQ